MVFSSVRVSFNVAVNYAQSMSLRGNESPRTCDPTVIWHMIRISDKKRDNLRSVLLLPLSCA